MRNQFELDESIIYLNNGTHSIVPRKILTAITSYQKEYERNPTQGLMNAWGRLWDVQKKVGKFLNARPEDLFFRPNVTEALNAIILGVDLPAGSEILAADLEYGAIVNQCRYRAERDGLKFRQYTLKNLGSGRSEGEVFETVVRELKPETSLLLLSHVVTANGLKPPIKKIAKHCRERGVLLVADGAHSTGAMPVDFGDLADVDFYAGNFHKWMMGPKGTGFGWVHERNQDKMSLVSAGWTTFEKPKPFELFGGGSRFAEKLFFSACRDFAPFFALGDLVDCWTTDWNPETIHARIRELQKFCIAEVERELGWKLLSPQDERLRGPLVSFALPESWAAQGYSLMTELLEKDKLQLSFAPYGEPVGKSFCVRFSPHVYNTEEEITTAMKVLRKRVDRTRVTGA